MHPAKPKVGIRAEKPDEVWHIDTTTIRLIDGMKTCLHSVIDNFSRRILSWRISPSFNPGNTVAVLLEASRASTGDKPTVLTDGGVESVNARVDELTHSGLLRSFLAMTELRTRAAARQDRLRFDPRPLVPGLRTGRFRCRMAAGAVPN